MIPKVLSIHPRPGRGSTFLGVQPCVQPQRGGGLVFSLRLAVALGVIGLFPGVSPGEQEGKAPEVAGLRLLAMPAGVWDKLAEEAQEAGQGLLGEAAENRKFEVVSLRVPLRNGSGSVMENRKDWIYQTAFVWGQKGPEVHPSGRKELLVSGTFAEVKLADTGNGATKVELSFNWTPEPGTSVIPGAPVELKVLTPGSIIFKGAFAARERQTVVAEWRSGICPPGDTSAGPWQYMLVFSLP